MGQEDILKQILEALRRLERGLPQDDPQPRSVSSRPADPRATEQFPKIELAIKAEIERHTEKCALAMKEKMGAQIDPLSTRVKTLEEKLSEAKKDLGGRINGAREDAAKTATGTVVSVDDKIRGIMEILKGLPNVPGLEEMVRDLGQWVEEEEQRRANAAERSRFSITTVLAAIGIFAAIALGVLNLVIGK
jgi:hypothetical protein